MTSVPVMSLGIRSGVNWMRLKERCSVCESVDTSNVLARPGTPTSSAWLRVRIAMSTWSTTCFLADDDLAEFGLDPRACGFEVLDSLQVGWVRGAGCYWFGQGF